LIGLREKWVLIVAKCSGGILSGFDYGMVGGKELWLRVVMIEEFDSIRGANGICGWDGSVELN
jgi:hypothetical protein